MPLLEGTVDMTGQDSAEELSRLENELRTVLKTRMDLQRGLANPDALRAATARAYRDRDAVTNPLLEDARDGIVEVIEKFHEAWRNVDKAAREMERYADFIDEAPLAVQDCRAEVLTAVPAVRAARARVGQRVVEAGLIGVVPEEEAADGEG